MAGRPIASESTRLLRSAKSAKARGYSPEVSNALAMAGYQAKEKEPRGIQNQEDIWTQQDLDISEGYAKAQAAKQAAAENLMGRIAFAEELQQRAGNEQPEGFDLRSFAEPRAAELGISQGALTSFFQRNKLPMTTQTTATTEGSETSKLPDSASKSEVIEAQNKDRLAREAAQKSKTSPIPTPPRYGGALNDLSSLPGRFYSSY